MFPMYYICVISYLSVRKQLDKVALIDYSFIEPPLFEENYMDVRIKVSRCTKHLHIFNQNTSKRERKMRNFESLVYDNDKNFLSQGRDNVGKSSNWITAYTLSYSFESNLQ